MTKRILTFALCLVFSLGVVWGGMFAADCLRAQNLQRPLFALAHVTADDGGTGLYQGLGYTVNIEGELTAEYGYVVQKAELSLLGKVVAASVS